MLRFLTRQSLHLGKNLEKCGTVHSRSFSKKEDDGEFSKRVKEEWRNVKHEWKNVKDTLKSVKSTSEPYELPNADVGVPMQADVVIIGGGVMGSSIAYWLKRRVFQHMKVVVVERDPTYTKASTALSVGGLRQQFSLPENIEMSLYGAEFIRELETHLGVIDEPPIDPYFNPHGYLMLSTENGAPTLTNNSKLQNEMGAKNILLSPEKLKDFFPWINTEGIALGCFGLEKEGWFDPWSLLCAFKRKAMFYGVDYVSAEAKGFVMKNTSEVVGDNLVGTQSPDELIVKTPQGETRTIKFNTAVIAAGAFSADVAAAAGIGSGPGSLSIPLPVEPRKRYVYCFHCPDGPGINTPLTVDPSGTYFRRDGLAGNYIGGRQPLPHEEPTVEDLSVNDEFFTERVWPALAHRVRAFENLKVKSSWAGYYEYNTFDKNGIIGRHPHHQNICIATGFSGHGIQQSPAVGRAVAELIIDGSYQTIDLTRLGFDRFITQERMLEANVF